MIGMHLYFEYPDPQVHQAVVSLQSYNSFRNVFCFRDTFKYIVQMYPTANRFWSHSHEVELKAEIGLELDGKWVTRNGQDIASKILASFRKRVLVRLVCHSPSRQKE